MRGILGKFDLRKINLGKISLWKFYRKLAVILAVLLVFQSMPIKAEQSGQVYENAADTEEETVQGEGENGTGNEGEGGSGTGNEGEGNGNGTGSEGEGNETGSEGDGNETGSEGNGNGAGNEGEDGNGDGNGAGNEGGGTGEEGGNEGDESGSKTLELEFEIPEPGPQVYTDGKFINRVRGKDGTELSGVTIQYIIDNTEIASIDSDTGEVTFLKAGTVKVTAEVTEKTSAEGGTVEGGTTEEGTTEGGITEEGTTEGGTAEGGTTEGGTVAGGTTEGGTTEEGTTEEGTTEEGTTTDEDKITITSISYTLVIEKAPQTIAFEKNDQNFSILYGQYCTFSSSQKAC